TSADFQVIDVGLGGLEESYLAPQDLEPGSIAVRTLPAGELVPRGSIADEERSRTTTVVVSSMTIPAGMEAGTPVELWHAPMLEDGRTPDAPRILVADAIVSRVAEAEGMLSQSRTEVELGIDPSEVRPALAPITGRSILSIL